MTTLGEFNGRALEIGGKPQWRAKVLLVHGINTTGPWQKSFTPILSQHEFVPVPVDYGFNRISVARPKRLLNRASEAVWAEYQRHYSPKMPISAVGHSFGTLALGNIVNCYRDAAFDRVILTGSILARDYPWIPHIESRQVKGVLNEISEDDSVVGLCRLLKLFSWSLPVGHSGKDGFNCSHPEVLQRTHKAGHSGALNDVALRKVWIPFLRNEPPIQ